MMSAFNTIQLELERLILLRETIQSIGVDEDESANFDQLNNKISEHEHAIQIIVRESQREQRLANAFNRLAH